MHLLKVPQIIEALSGKDNRRKVLEGKHSRSYWIEVPNIFVLCRDAYRSYNMISLGSHEHKN